MLGFSISSFDSLEFEKSTPLLHQTRVWSRNSPSFDGNQIISGTTPFSLIKEFNIKPSIETTRKYGFRVSDLSL